MTLQLTEDEVKEKRRLAAIKGQQTRAKNIAERARKIEMEEARKRGYGSYGDLQMDDNMPDQGLFDVQ